MAVATYTQERFSFLSPFFFHFSVNVGGKNLGGGAGYGGTFEKVMTKRTSLLWLTCLHFFLGPLSGRKGHIQTVVQTCMPGLSRHRQ